jgi:hypothetical protein
MNFIYFPLLLMVRIGAQLCCFACKEFARPKTSLLPIDTFPREEQRYFRR